MESLPKKYNFQESEAHLRAWWEEEGVYHFSPRAENPVYSIDTPPPTVSGRLHMGHVYSYTHADVLARFWRMKGHAVFYPMGFDDNGLPTERLVERESGCRAIDMEREDFVARCLELGAAAEEEYRDLWRQLGLSVDWRHTYRTIGERAVRSAQWSFIDLYEKGLVYRREAPVLWCPHCQTAIAQADVEDIERESVLYELAFQLDNGEDLHIATTRPELLPACVAVFAHPEDGRFRDLLGRRLRVPLFNREVPLIADQGADPEKGTGAVMCCTFGDSADVEWWRLHDLPLRQALDRQGRLRDVAGKYAGLAVAEARQAIVEDLRAEGCLKGQEDLVQSVRVHERCATPIEYLVTEQWFVRVLEYKRELLAAGEQLIWRPSHMKAKYRQWVENLNWDWCISRQRHFGVSFPVWYCASCGAVRTAEKGQLPVAWAAAAPPKPCDCGGTEWEPERDVMDTWATSALTPQIAGQWDGNEELYKRVFPMSVRPLAHEIIRTWAFYSIVKAHHHFGVLPWRELVVSGWGLAPEGKGKISKSRGGGPATPQETLAKYPADAVRYWATGTGLGKDTLINEEKIEAGAKFLTKLWNVARFSASFLGDFEMGDGPPALSPADGWLLSRLQGLIQRVSAALEQCDYATARNDIEAFFWKELADNYLEMAKKRLYDEDNSARVGAQYALFCTLRALIKLLAPFLPYVTEVIYQRLFARLEACNSVHLATWPEVDQHLIDGDAEKSGEILLGLAGAVRRYKSAASLSLGAEIPLLQIGVEDPESREKLQRAEADIASVTRARCIEWHLEGDGTSFDIADGIQIAVINR